MKGLKFSWLMPALLALTMIGCASATGKTVGRTVDDSVITAKVKSKLAAESVGTLTRIGVDTVEGTVYLTGIVNKPELRERATMLASEVSGVREVVNNLRIGSATQ